MTEEIKEVEDIEPTQEQIEKWKEQFGKIYSTNLGGVEYIFRRLLRSEFKNITKSNATVLQQQLDAGHTMEDSVTILCTLCPVVTKDNINKLPAGVPTSLSGIIMEKSGFDDMAEAVEL